MTMQNDREKEARELLANAYEEMGIFPLTREELRAGWEIQWSERPAINATMKALSTSQALLAECREVLKPFGSRELIQFVKNTPKNKEGIAFFAGAACIGYPTTLGSCERAASLIEKLDALSDNKDRAGG